MELFLDQAQLAFFTPGINLSNKLQIANAINTQTGDLFSGDPIILPVPSDAPSEIPRILLRSQDRRYRLDISEKRIRFYFNPQREDEIRQFPLSRELELFVSIADYFIEEANTQIIRCGFVTNWVLDLGKRPGAATVCSQYIRDDAPVPEPYVLEVHYQLREQLGDFDANIWTRIKSTRMQEQPEQDWFVVLNIDINTFEERTYDFSTASLESFLRDASTSMNELVQQHSQTLEGNDATT